MHWLQFSWIPLGISALSGHVAAQSPELSFTIPPPRGHDFRYVLAGLEATGEVVYCTRRAGDRSPTRDIFFLDPTTMLERRVRVDGYVADIDCPAADFDGDGVDDILVLLGRRDGAFLVALSGADLSTLYTVRRRAATDDFGGGVAIVGDVDGDNVPDLAVGESDAAPSTTIVLQAPSRRSSTIAIHSGTSGDLIAVLGSEAAFGGGGIFGRSIGSVDVGQSCRRLYSVTATVSGLRTTYQSYWPVAGLVWSSPGDLLITIPIRAVDASPITRLALSPSARTAYVASPDHAMYAGAVTSTSLATRRENWRRIGASGDGLGWQVLPVSDVDADGVDDVVVSAPGLGPLTRQEQLIGSVHILSSRTGEDIASFTDGVASSAFGYRLAKLRSNDADLLLILAPHSETDTGRGVIHVYEM